MSAAFFITTGEFLQYLPDRRKVMRLMRGGGWQWGDGGFPVYTINGNEAPHEGSHLNGFPERRPSFFDDKPLQR
jgi:hypothetical protein